MRKSKIVFFELLLWYSLLELIRKPAALIDRLHQYAIGKLLIAKLNRDKYFHHEAHEDHEKNKRKTKAEKIIKSC